MGNEYEKVQVKEEISLQELVTLTKDFIKLADSLYKKNKLTEEEYNELTFLKKDFLAKVANNEIN